VLFRSAEGLREFLEKVRPLLEGTPLPLATLLRQVAIVETFVERTAPEVVVVYDYLRSEELVSLNDADLQTRRGQILMLIAQGEKLISEETSFRRQVQILLSVYKRRYVAWHARCYRMSVFDKYRALSRHMRGRRRWN